MSEAHIFNHKRFAWSVCHALLRDSNTCMRHVRLYLLRMASLLERTRLLHEEVERKQKAMIKLLDAPPKNVIYFVRFLVAL